MGNIPSNSDLAQDIPTGARVVSRRNLRHSGGGGSGPSRWRQKRQGHHDDLGSRTCTTSSLSATISAAFHRDVKACEVQDMLGFRDDQDHVRALEVFRTADYTDAAISKAIGREEILRMPSSDVPHVLRRTPDPSRLNTLIRLYFLGMPVPAGRSPVSVGTRAAGLLDRRRTCSARRQRRPGAPRVQIWPVAA